MDQAFVLKVQIIVLISARFNVKNVNLFNFATFDKYILEIEISQVCDCTKVL